MKKIFLLFVFLILPSIVFAVLGEPTGGRILKVIPCCNGLYIVLLRFLQVVVTVPVVETYMIDYFYPPVFYTWPPAIFPGNHILGFAIRAPGLNLCFLPPACESVLEATNRFTALGTGELPIKK